MDTKVEIKEEAFSDTSLQEEPEYVTGGVTPKTNSDAVLLDEVYNQLIKTEIESEAAFANSCLQNEEECFTEYQTKQIKCETITYSNSSCGVDTTTEIQGQVLVSQNEDAVMKVKYSNDDEIVKKVDAKEENSLLQTENSTGFGYIQDGDIFPVKSLRLCTEAVSEDSNGKPLLGSAEDSGRSISFKNCSDHPEYEVQESDATKTPALEDLVLSEESGKHTEGKICITALHLKQKNLVHEGKKMHKCKCCEKSFTQLSHLKRHNLIHEGKRPHKCDICEKRFTLLSNLKVHILIHEGTKPYRCEVCGKSFAAPSNLKVHSLIHVGQKRPYKCEICEKSFTALSGLKLHNLIHEGKRPHKCKICGKSFTQLGHLRTHILIHEGKRPHGCEICEKSFTSMSGLKRHKLIHSDKRPYKCEVCEKNFIRLSDMKRHRLTHSGERPHKCKSCDKSFTRLSSLKTHNLIHQQ